MYDFEHMLPAWQVIALGYFVKQICPKLTSMHALQWKHGEKFGKKYLATTKLLGRGLNFQNRQNHLSPVTRFLLQQNMLI